MGPVTFSWIRPRLVIPSESDQVKKLLCWWCTGVEVNTLQNGASGGDCVVLHSVARSFRASLFET